MREREARNRLLNILNESDDVRFANADEFDGTPAIVVDLFEDGQEQKFVVLVVKPHEQ